MTTLCSSAVKKVPSAFPSRPNTAAPLFHFTMCYSYPSCGIPSYRAAPCLQPESAPTSLAAIVCSTTHLRTVLQNSWRAAHKLTACTAYRQPLSLHRIMLVLNIGSHRTRKFCVVNCGNADMSQIRRLNASAVTNVTVTCAETSWKAPPVMSHGKPKFDQDFRLVVERLYPKI